MGERGRETEGVGALAMAGKAGTRGPVARTLLMMLHSGPKGGAVSGSLQPECVEGLLSYARLLLAQPHAGKLSVLIATGKRVQTVTSWDPGQQSVDAIVQGLAHWKAPEGDSGYNIKHVVQNAIGLLFQPSGNSRLDMDAQRGPSDHMEEETTPAASIWKTVRTRLVVIIPYTLGAGSRVHMYHKLMVEALASSSMKKNDVGTCDAVFLDLSILDNSVEPLVSSNVAANSNIHLATSYYKLPPAQALDLFLDLAYFHLELSAIVIRGMLPQLLQFTEGETGRLSLRERELKDGKLGTMDTDVRLVLYQSHTTLSFSGEASHFPGTPGFRKARTASLQCTKTSLSTLQLLAFPCTSVSATLLEVFHRGPAAKIWETLKNQDNTLASKLVLALSTEEDAINVTHLFVWREGRFWLHTLRPLESRDLVSTTADGDEASGVEAGPPGQDSVHPTTDSMLSTPPRKTTGGNAERPVSRHSGKKRKQEETDDTVSQGSPLAGPGNVGTSRSKKSPTHSSKHLERHSASLAALLSPIRGAFIAEELPSDYLNTASKCVARLQDFTERNDASIFPLTADMSAARKELYKKVWRELEAVARQTRDKTRGQEDLANAIYAAGSEPKFVEEKVALTVPHPVLPEKQSEFAPVNKRRRCEEVLRDTHGRPVLPIKLGPSLQVYDLGKVVWNRPNFHSEKYIWPSGYKSRRAYASMLNSENRIFYWCEIIDDGQAPEFRLTPEDDQNNPVVGISATAVWTVVVKRVGALRIEEGGKKTFANVSGPEYFGYANPTIARLIQQLPNAEKCTKYRRQEYLPNVPMRPSDTDSAQAGMVRECPSSPQNLDQEREGPASSSLSGDESNQAPISTPHVDQGVEGVLQSIQGGVAPGEDEDEWQGMHSPSRAPCKDIAAGCLSWLTEFHITQNEKMISKFPKQFAGCSPGSLFNHYWSAKLRRAQPRELDGQK